MPAKKTHRIRPADRRRLIAEGLSSAQIMRIEKYAIPVIEAALFPPDRNSIKAEIGRLRDHAVALENTCTNLTHQVELKHGRVTAYSNLEAARAALDALDAAFSELQPGAELSDGSDVRESLDSLSAACRGIAELAAQALNAPELNGPQRRRVDGDGNWVVAIWDAISHRRMTKSLSLGHAEIEPSKFPPPWETQRPFENVVHICYELCGTGRLNNSPGTGREPSGAERPPAHDVPSPKTALRNGLRIIRSRLDPVPQSKRAN